MENGRFGEVVPPGDRVALASLLDRWGKDPDRLKAFAAKALQRAERYRASTVLEKIEDEARALVGSTGKPFEIDAPLPVPNSARWD